MNGNDAKTNGKNGKTGMRGPVMKLGRLLQA